MRTLIRLALFCCSILGMNAAVFACGASYDPVTGLASVPCVDVAAEGKSFSVSLQAAGANVTVTAAREFNLLDPVLPELRILLNGNGAFSPTAVVTGFYSPCGGGSFSRATFSRTDNNVDIRVKIRVPALPDVTCTSQALQPFAEAVGLFVPADPRTQTYSVNGQRVTPVFLTF
jgi:hypothetical protein